MARSKTLFICSTANTAAILHRVALALPETDAYFTSVFSDHAFVNWVKGLGLLVDTPLDGRFKRRTDAYFEINKLAVDYMGKAGDYKMVVTSQDLIYPQCITKVPVVMVQEGMTDPLGLYQRLVARFGLPGWWALNTALNGVSNKFDKLCVASEGYKEHYLKLGIPLEKIVITGLPNYDDLAKNINNNFPYKNFVLVATSDIRETYGSENRKKSIQGFLEIAAGRPLIFKLHPNENHARAIKEIEKYAPSALIFTEGNPDEMIANCDVLITQYSTLAYVGLALGKETHSYFDIEELKRKTPVQNGGASAQKIAEVCRQYL